MGIRVFRVAHFGLQPNEVNVLKSVCLLSGAAARSCRHEATPNTLMADVFLVDGAVESARREWLAADPGASRPVLMVGADIAPPAKGRSLRRPLLASRLLGALDDMARDIERVPPRTLMPVTNVGAPAAAPRRRAAGPNGVPARPAALVVDDSPTVRKQLEIVLRGEDIDVVTAVNGEEALDALAQREFAIVLLDVVLPGTDGYQVCKAIKKNPATRHLPIVMLTSKSSPFDRIRGSLAGCDAYLVKPVSQSGFIATVGKYVRAAEAPRDAAAAPA